MSRLTRPQPAKLQALAAAALAVAALAGCGQSDDDGLHQWMAQTRAAKAPPPEPLPEVKSYTPREYGGRASPEPFAQTKIGELNKTMSESPEAGRRHEPLEDYPLENFKMLGMLKKNGETYGVVRVDNKIHHVKVGQYLGQSYGRVVRISDQEIVLRELVREGVSDWKEKMTSLKLEASA
ncbi:Type IV pilus biogenesis protein PilP [Cupriavidus sp. U2]|uniref:pilus assembly protein PilP n=1 Tax=Cupriavidus sp. U2 TaxID=2920269 RepID=UPI001EB8A037|nr:pilus assembly protein PilP [Cupriavidus sp. U2]KAI3591998.1 Type IV pilus biogenesis protein PilP [Cupriavidus sp. U2]